MDRVDSSTESDSAADLENGKKRSGDDEKSKELGCNGRHLKRISKREQSVVRGPNADVKGDDGLGKNKNVLGSSDSMESLDGEVGEEAMSLGKKKMMVEKGKKSSFNKPPKPPRPPGSPSFDEADMMLVREISELARQKQARIGRIKALKRRRVDRASSSVVNIFAMIITVMFCFVIIFQGILGSHL
ncbi:hypothetical protein Pint_19570 [Pistacia integerrima]|uniref:Uncharacterized protein n=1 Tax=Pistacia integerrima TaxID=434235 RepID=A0ACC0XEQ7_9ROSI|nr:hypothetical protein Pint_19570 [Pistacia integerrima]